MMYRNVDGEYQRRGTSSSCCCGIGGWEGLVFWLVPMPSFWGASVGALVVVTMALVATVALVGTVGGNVVEFRSKVGNQGKDLRA